MPFPKEEHKIGGGCICGAVQFQLLIPAESDRLRISSTVGNSITVPYVVMDHELSHGLAGCMPAQMVVLKKWVTFDCSTSEHVDNQGLGIDKKASKKSGSHIINGTIQPEVKRELHKLSEITNRVHVNPTKAAAIRSSFVRMFRLDEKHWEVHCARCASSLIQGDGGAIGAWPAVHVNVAFINLEHRKKPFMAPSRHVNWRLAVDWTKSLTFENRLGGSLPKHPDRDLKILAVTSTSDLETEAQRADAGTQTHENSVWDIDVVKKAKRCVNPTVHRVVVKKAPKRKYGLGEVMSLMTRMQSAQGLDVMQVHSELTAVLKEAELDTDDKEWWKSLAQSVNRRSENAKAAKIEPR